MPESNMVQPTDGQGKVFVDPTWLPGRCEKSIVFAGATENAWGDDGGDLDGGAVFVVTGTVRVRMVAVCTVDLVGSTTLELGVTGSTAALIAQIADASGIGVNEIWFGADAPAPTLVITSAPEIIVCNGNDIILTNGTNITAGEITFFCAWHPISADGNVVPSDN